MAFPGDAVPWRAWAEHHSLTGSTHPHSAGLLELSCHRFFIASRGHGGSHVALFEVEPSRVTERFAA
jgi:hypothetical protein